MKKIILKILNISVRNKLLIIGFINLILLLSLLFVDCLRGVYSDVSLPPYTVEVGRYLIAVLVLLGANYALLYSWLGKDIITKSHFKIILIFGFLFSMILCFMWPITSADAFNYIFSGKLITNYDVNPYVAVYDNYQQDEVYNYTVQQWRDKASPYGPLWLLLMAVVSLLGTGSVVLSLYVLKFLFLLAFWGCVYLLYKILYKHNIKNKFFYLTLFIWNPLLLWEGLLNLHNDIFIALLLLAVIYLMMQKRFILMFLFLWLSVLIKYITLLLLPFFVIYFYKKIKIKNWFIIVGLIFIVTLLSYAWFLNAGEAIWQGLLTQGTQKESLGYYAPLPYFLLMLLVSFLSSELSTVIVMWCINILFIVLYFVLLRKLLKNNSEDNLIKFSCLSLILYVFVASFWWQSWYVLWLLPLLVLPVFYKYKWLLVIITCLSLAANFIPIAWGFYIAVILVFSRQWLLHVKKYL